MKFKKALLVDIAETDLDKEYWNQLNELVDNKVFISKSDLPGSKELADTDVLMLGFQIPVDRAVIDAAPNLKFINVLATAYGTVDTDYAKSKGIPVSNLGGYSTESVAEFVIAVLLEQIRELEKGKQAGRKRDFSFDSYKVREIKDSNFVVVGLGNIGTRVAEIAAGFGAHVSYVSRTEKKVPFKKVDLSNLKDADFISINAAQTEESEGMISAEIINSLKNDAVLVNTCPPELIDQDALAEKLKNNKDFYFIFDHGDEMSNEDLDNLLQYENCIAYPVIGFISDQAKLAKQENFVGNLRGALEGKPQNQVN